MLLSRCCNTPVEEEWNLFLTKSHLVCKGCHKVIGYDETVWVKTK